MSEFNAGTIVGTADLDRDPFTRGLEEARRQADEFSRRRVTVTPDVDTRTATAELEALQRRINELHGSTVTPDVDTRVAAAELAALQARIDEVTRNRTVDVHTNNTGGIGNTGTRQAAKDASDAGSAFGFLASKMTLVVALAGSLLPAIVPLTGALTGLTIALAGGLAAGALAIGSFAVVAVSDFADVSKAMKKVGGDASQLPANLRPLGSVVEQLKFSFAALKQETSGAVLGAMTAGVKVLTSLMPTLVPIINATGKGLQMMFSIFQNVVQGPAFKNFAAMVTKDVGPALTGLGVILGNTFNGLFRMFVTFEPLLKSLGREVENLTGKFDTWTLNGGLTTFFQHISHDIHEVMPLLKQLGDLFVTVFHILAPSSGEATKTLTAIVTALNQMEPALQAVVALTQPVGRLLQVVLPAVVPVINALGRVASALIPVMNAVARVIGVAFADAAKLAVPIVNDVVAAIKPLVPVVVQLVNSFIPLIDTVFRALQPLLPPISHLFQALSTVLTAVVKDCIPVVTTFTTLAGDVLPPVVRIVGDLVQWLADLLNHLTPLAPVIVAVGVAWAALKVGSWVTTVVAGLGRMIGLLPTILAHMRSWISYNLGTSAGLSGILGGITKIAGLGAIAAVASGLISWANAGKQAKAAIDGIKSSINNFDLSSINAAISKVQALNDAAVKGNSGGSLVVGALNDATFHLFGKSSALGNSATIKQSQAELAALRAEATNLGLALDQLGGKYNLTGDQIQMLAQKAKISFGDGTGNVWKSLNDGEAAFNKLYGAQLKDLPINNSLTTNFTAQGVAAKATSDKIDGLASVVENLLNKQESMIQSTDGFHKALNDLGTQLDTSNHSLVGTTDAAINNRSALIQLVNTAESAAKATAHGSTTSAAYTNTLKYGLAVIENTAAANGLNKKQVDALIRSLGLVPPTTPARVTTPGLPEAQQGLNVFLQTLHNLANSPVRVPVTAYLSNPGAIATELAGSAMGLSVTGKARGGFLSGPGTGTSDSLLIAASNGEFVSTAKATAAHRAELEAWNAQSNSGRYAQGGAVSSGLTVTSGDLGAKLDTLIDLMRRSPGQIGDEFGSRLSTQTRDLIVASRTE